MTTLPVPLAVPPSPCAAPRCWSLAACGDGGSDSSSSADGGDAPAVGRDDLDLG